MTSLPDDANVILRIYLVDAYLAGLVAEGAHDAVATFDEALGRVTKVPVIGSAAELPLL